MRKPPVVRLDDVVVRADGRTVLGPISLHISADDRWVVLGPNGCGKTTLAEVGHRRGRWFASTQSLR
jgi:iron complex transport system ATP-binding protein